MRSDVSSLLPLLSRTNGAKDGIGVLFCSLEGVLSLVMVFTACTTVEEEAGLFFSS